ncbi:MAG: sugar ABC transporter permease [Clostridia bacterium]|nr:sugar ABC transporter permease [Clostridia bacterium]
MSLGETRRIRARMSRAEKKRTLIAYSFLAPNFLGFAIFTLVPVVCAIALSFFEWNGGDISRLKFVGFDNYATIFNVKKVSQNGLAYFFNRVDLGISLKNTIFYTLITVPLTIVCALALALLLNKIRGAVAYRTIFFFPYVASMVAICVCWSFMLMKDGPINQFIQAIGIPFNKSWTADSAMAIWAIILVSVWRNMGYYMVIYLAALQGVPRELLEAATVDGAGKWKQFIHVTLPQLRPTTFFVSIMMIISCFKIYDVVAIMTDGGPGRSTKMLVTYIYDEAFVKIRYGQASAISMILLVIVLVITIIQFRSEKKFSSD